MSRETLTAPQHQHPDRDDRPARHRLALPRRGAGRGDQPLPRTHPRRGRRTTAVPLAGPVPTDRGRDPADLDRMTHLDPLGSPARWVQVDDRQAITRSDTDAVLGIFTSGYVMHQYREWLLSTVANILDDDLVISSAGLLRGGAIAWVEVVRPRDDHHPGRVRLPAQPAGHHQLRRVHRHHLQADRHGDGVRQHQRPGPQRARASSTRSSTPGTPPRRSPPHGKPWPWSTPWATTSPRSSRSSPTPPSSEHQWRAFLDAHVPLDDGKGHALEGRSRTLATRKRGELENLYRHDGRAAPWTGTALGRSAGDQHLGAPQRHRPPSHEGRAEPRQRHQRHHDHRGPACPRAAHGLGLSRLTPLGPPDPRDPGASGTFRRSSRPPDIRWAWG